MLVIKGSILVDPVFVLLVMIRSRVQGSVPIIRPHGVSGDGDAVSGQQRTEFFPYPARHVMSSRKTVRFGLVPVSTQDGVNVRGHGRRRW
jgi:hypothetical protein